MNYKKMLLVFQNIISFSYIFKLIRKNDIPKENTSDNSGLNIPVPNPFYIFNISGDI